MNTNILVIGIVVVVVILGGAYWAFGMGGLNTLSSNQPSGDSQDIPGLDDPSPLGGDNNAAGGTSLMAPTLAARAALAARLAVPEDDIVVVKEEERTWSDGCLGLAKPDELCTEALVDGYRIEMTAKGKTYFYRTDKAGTNLRAETK